MVILGFNKGNLINVSALSFQQPCCQRPIRLHYKRLKVQIETRCLDIITVSGVIALSAYLQHTHRLIASLMHMCFFLSCGGWICQLHSKINKRCSKGDQLHLLRETKKTKSYTTMLFVAWESMRPILQDLRYTLSVIRNSQDNWQLFAWIYVYSGCIEERQSHERNSREGTTKLCYSRLHLQHDAKHHAVQFPRQAWSPVSSTYATTRCNTWNGGFRCYRQRACRVLTSTCMLLLIVVEGSV